MSQVVSQLCKRQGEHWQPCKLICLTALVKALRAQGLGLVVAIEIQPFTHLLTDSHTAHHSLTCSHTALTHLQQPLTHSLTHSFYTAQIRILPLPLSLSLCACSNTLKHSLTYLKSLSTSHSHTSPTKPLNLCISADWEALHAVHYAEAQGSEHPWNLRLTRTQVTSTLPAGRPRASPVCLAVTGIKPLPWLCWALKNSCHHRTSILTPD